MLAVLVLLWDERLPVSDVKLTGELGLTGKSAGSSWNLYLGDIQDLDSLKAIDITSAFALLHLDIACSGESSQNPKGVTKYKGPEKQAPNFTQCWSSKSQSLKHQRVILVTLNLWRFVPQGIWCHLLDKYLKICPLPMGISGTEVTAAILERGFILYFLLSRSKCFCLLMHTGSTTCLGNSWAFITLRAMRGPGSADKEKKTKCLD